MGKIDQGLNPEQAAAVAHTSGPLVILAGAGTGKTLTITRRIAAQVLTGGFRPGQILALTFTTKAAGELDQRLRDLGVAGVRGRTFHSAASGILRRVLGDDRELLPSKYRLLRPLVRALPRPYSFRVVKDFADEIERAHNHGVSARAYPQGMLHSDSPVPVDLMQRIFRDYEQAKARHGLLDYEDLLSVTTERLRDSPDQLSRVRSSISAVTVDEYQDVNPLQQALLDALLGDNRELCVVGDDYQAIYSFTGASPNYLLDFTRRYPEAHVATLERNYRSTDQVVQMANRLVPHMGGSGKHLVAGGRAGVEPTFSRYANPEEEAEAVVAEVGRLVDAGTPANQLAILFRANAHSEPFEESLIRHRIPFVAPDGGLLQRPAGRELIRFLEARPSGSESGNPVRSAAESLGWLLDGSGSALGREEETRQADFNRLVDLADAFDWRGGGTEAFVADLRDRFLPQGEGSGVALLTYHRSKGLEFDAVFLPRLQEGVLPDARSTADEELAEERRLFYVGITRARHLLHLSSAPDGRSSPSRFLAELGLIPSRSAVPARSTARSARRSGGGSPQAAAAADPATPAGRRFARLRLWRGQKAVALEVPAYTVFHDSTLHAIATLNPRDFDALATVSGVGPVKLERFGNELLSVLELIPDD